MQIGFQNTRGNQVLALKPKRSLAAPCKALYLGLVQGDQCSFGQVRQTVWLGRFVSRTVWLATRCLSEGRIDCDNLPLLTLGLAILRQNPVARGNTLASWRGAQKKKLPLNIGCEAALGWSKLPKSIEIDV